MAKGAPQIQVVSIEDITSQLISTVTSEVASRGIELSPKSIMQVLSIAMEAVEGSPVKGAQQKDLAIKVVLQVAENAGLPEEQLTIIKALVDGGFVSDTIDLVIAASQGKLNVNQAVDVAKGCFTTCFSSIFKKKAPKALPVAATPVAQPTPTAAPTAAQPTTQAQAQAPVTTPQVPTAQPLNAVVTNPTIVVQAPVTATASDIVDVPAATQVTNEAVV